jgi:hypothetical protein
MTAFPSEGQRPKKKDTSVNPPNDSQDPRSRLQPRLWFWFWFWVLQRLLSHAPPPVGHRFELDPAAALPHHLHAAGFDPPPEVLALADVEDLEVSAAFDDGFDARARHANAPAHG